MTDGLGHTTAWMDLTAAPQFLSLEQSGVSTVWVERNVDGDITTPSWFTMDDITYNAAPVPEPASMALLACAMGGIGATLRKRRKV